MSDRRLRLGANIPEKETKDLAASGIGIARLVRQKWVNLARYFM